MDKVDALESIKEAWDDKGLSLGDRILRVSNDFYAAGLDIEGTAAYLHTTVAELESILELGQFDDEIIEKISEVNPPKITWAILSSGSEEEVNHALDVLAKKKANSSAANNGVDGDNEASDDDNSKMDDEYIYEAMMEIAGPTLEQRVENLSYDALKHARKKGMDFGTLNDWEAKFLNSIAGQKRSGKTLTQKQLHRTAVILTKLVENGVIKHDSIDGDQEICDQILGALDM